MKDYREVPQVAKAYADTDELAFHELCKTAISYLEKSDDEYHEGENSMGAYYLIVAERFFNEMKVRVVTTSI